MQGTWSYIYSVQNLFGFFFFSFKSTNINKEVNNLWSQVFTEW